MRAPFTLFLLSALTFAGFSSAAQAADTYTLDKPHTQIVFYADHLGFTRSIGKFTDYEGGFVFDSANPAQSSAEVTIKTASVELNDGKWNEHMKSADFLDVEKFPVMTFKSTDIKVLSDKTADITGDLTLRGVTKPVTLHTTFNKEGKFPYGDMYKAGFSADATIKRSDFGMTYGLPGIADDVVIRIEVEGNRVNKEEKPQPAAQ